MSRKNITRSCDVCSLSYRGTNGRVCFESRAGSRHQWARPAYTAAARCVRVFPASSAQNLSHLHKSSVQDQDASNICAAALQSLRSVRHSACYGVLLFEGTPSALLVRFGLTAPNLRTRRGVTHHNNTESISFANQRTSGSRCRVAGMQSEAPISDHKHS
jgi:hypothetical protein